MADHPPKTSPEPPETPIPDPPSDYDPIQEERLSALPEALGFRLVEWREGFAAMAWPMSELAVNRQGLAHGGAIATLIDTTAGYAAVFCPYPGRRRRAMTLSLTVQFLAAIRDAGAVMRSEAEITGGGAATAFIDARVLDGRRRLIATASGVFRLRSDSRSLWGAPRDVG